MSGKVYAGHYLHGLKAKPFSRIATPRLALREFLRIVRHSLAHFAPIRPATRSNVIDAQRPLAQESSGLERGAVLAAESEHGDLLLIDAGQTIAADGLVVEGLAIVDESNATGQSDLVIRSPEVISAVLRNSRVVAGKLLVRVAAAR